MRIHPAHTAALAAAALFLPWSELHATPDTWTGEIDNLWTEAGNWLNGNIPGTPDGSGGDVATFRASIETDVSLDGTDRTLGGILFDNSGLEDPLDAFLISGAIISTPINGGNRLFQVRGNFMDVDQRLELDFSVQGSSNNNDIGFFGSNGYTGTLFVTGLVDVIAESGTTQVSFRAGSGGTVDFSGAIWNFGNNVVLNIPQTNLGRVRLTGESAFAGSVLVRNGLLDVDFETSSLGVLPAEAGLRMEGGTVRFLAAETGASYQTLGPLTVSGSGASAAASSRLVLEPNGGNGLEVTTAEVWTRNSGFLNIVIPTGAKLKTTAALAGGATVDASSNGGVIQSTQAFATVTTGTGETYFATQNAQFEIVPQLAPNALPASAADNTRNYTLSGNLALAANVSTNTLRIDSNTTSGTLTLGTRNVASVRNSFLFDGDEDYTVTGTGAFGTGNGATSIQTFGDGLFSINSVVAGTGSGALVKGGPGFLALGGNNQDGKTGGTTVTDGVLRITSSNGLLPSLLNLNGGVLELAADLNGASAGDFDRALGAGAGNVSFNSVNNGGFSAFSGATDADIRVVNLGGASAPVTWGMGLFVQGAFLLSSTKADAVIDFQNAIDFNGADRSIVVADNPDSTADGAELSGALTNGGLNKEGAGPLEITGTSNTYVGSTRVGAGELIVTGSLDETMIVEVEDGATLSGDGSVYSDSVTYVRAGGKLSPGKAGIGDLTLGDISWTDEAVFAIELGANTGDSVSVRQVRLDGDASLQITLTADPIDFTAFTILNGSALLSGSGRFLYGTNRLTQGELFTVNSGLFAQTFQINYAGDGGRDVVLTAVPEPAIGSLGALAAAGFLVRRRRK